jgi:hypothetical protein|uniref:Uncharacterized protein n=1 Tax=Myoviridae sp. ctqfO1 TaxID=2827710 RepID=A0A8S5T425_9CAUD|nr:MAG TPA: hypothetical protein [Myoviridae sp. ctqfO1]
MSNTKITEKFEYKTDIIKMYNGDEQRIKTRQVPRHYLTYDYSAMDTYQAQYLRGILRMRHTDVYYIPMWHQPVYLKEDFIKNGKALYIDTKYIYNLLDCEYIEIFVRDDVNQTGINIVKQVKRYDDEKIMLIKKIPRPLLKENTWIFGLKKCSVQPNAGLQYIYSNGTEVGLSFEDLNESVKTQLPYKDEFEYQENIKHYNTFKLPQTFNGKEVFFNNPQWIDDSSVGLTVDKGVARLDNATGIFTYDLINCNSYDIHTYDIYLMCHEQIANFKKFFRRMCGMYKSFYMPTWVNDFQIDRDVEASDNAIYTTYNKMYKFYLSNTRKKYLVIFTKDFKSYILKIESYTYEKLKDDITYGKLIFDSAVGFNAKKEDILMCSYFNCVRFNDDAIQLNYESNIVAEVQFSVREVNDPEILTEEEKKKKRAEARKMKEKKEGAGSV